MDDVRRFVAVLSARVRDAHAAVEFGISRAQAYRLLDGARALSAISGAVADSTETSRVRDTGPARGRTCDPQAVVCRSRTLLHLRGRP